MWWLSSVYPQISFCLTPISFLSKMNTVTEIPLSTLISESWDFLPGQAKASRRWAWPQQQTQAISSSIHRSEHSAPDRQRQCQRAGVLISHILLFQGLKYLCISIFIPFAGMAGGCSNFSLSFFFFTFLGCRGDMLVTLVTVSPELESRGPYMREKSRQQWESHFVPLSSCKHTTFHF